MRKKNILIAALLSGLFTQTVRPSWHHDQLVPLGVGMATIVATTLLCLARSFTKVATPESTALTTESATPAPKGISHPAAPAPLAPKPYHHWERLTRKMLSTTIPHTRLTDCIIDSRSPACPADKALQKVVAEILKLTQEQAQRLRDGGEAPDFLPTKAVRGHTPVYMNDEVVIKPAASLKRALTAQRIKSLLGQIHSARVKSSKKAPITVHTPETHIAPYAWTITPAQAKATGATASPLTNQFYTLVQKHAGGSQEDRPRMSRETAEQLISAVKTGRLRIDLHAENVRVQEDGSITIIDLETEAHPLSENESIYAVSELLNFQSDALNQRLTGRLKTAAIEKRNNLCLNWCMNALRRIENYAQKHNLDDQDFPEISAQNYEQSDLTGTYNYSNAKAVCTMQRKGLLSDKQAEYFISTLAKVPTKNYSDKEFIAIFGYGPHAIQ